MKTPREFFFDKHRAAETKLDAIRENVVATVVARAPQPARRSFPVRAVLTLWRELILPCRRTWAGLATVWVAILAIHLASAESSSPMMATASAAPGPGILAAVREQRQMLVQLLDPLYSGPADRPKTLGPRGELRVIQFA